MSTSLTLTRLPVFLLILLISLPAVAQDAESQVLDTIVTYGDSLLAGFIDGSLIGEYQKFSAGAQLAERAKTPFPQPLIAEPGIPALRLKLINGFIFLLPNSDPGSRTDPDAAIQNFAVPGADVTTALRVRNLGATSDDTDLYKTILGGKKTMFQSVRKARPSLIIVWIGANDVLGMALNADINDHTNIRKFRRLYRRTINRMLSLDANIVAANLPDITTMPYLLNTEEWTILSAFGVKPDERVPATLLLDFLSTGKFPSFNDENVLDAAELEQIRNVIEEFNEVIDEILSEAGIPYVDMYTLTQRWDRHGKPYRAAELTMDWQGGLFSLDGVHPTFTGHALIANEFIDLINETWGTSIRRVNINKVIGIDPNISGASDPEQQRLDAARALEGIEMLKRAIERNKQFGGRR